MSEYDTDVLLWSEHQAALLRRRAAGGLVNDADLDWPNIAKEIESVGRPERLTLVSHIRTVMEHLIELELSPSRDPRRGWERTVRRTRLNIEDVLEGSPSLRRRVPAFIARVLHESVEEAVTDLAEVGEQPRRPPDEVSYTPGQVLGHWLP